MSDPIGMCRSNYFKVKDLEQFRKWATELGLYVYADDKTHADKIGKVMVATDEAYWPSGVMTPGGDFNEFAFCEELQTWLAPKQVAILQSVSHCKLRYGDMIIQLVPSKGRVIVAGSDNWLQGLMRKHFPKVKGWNTVTY